MGLELLDENIYTLIYQRLLDVIPDLLSIEESGKSEVKGLMPLNLDVIQRTPEKLVIAMSQCYRRESGDMTADPNMEIAVYLNRGMAEALTFQDANTYNTDYSSILMKRALNDFLHTWLGNLIAQGHSIKVRMGHQ